MSEVVVCGNGPADLGLYRSLSAWAWTNSLVCTCRNTAASNAATGGAPRPWSFLLLALQATLELKKHLVDNEGLTGVRYTRLLVGIGVVGFKHGRVEDRQRAKDGAHLTKC